MKKIAYMLLLPLFLASCSGYSVIQKSGNLSSHQINKIVFITPALEDYVVENGEIKRSFELHRLSEQKVYDILVRSAAKNNIEAEIIPEHQMDGKMADLRRNFAHANSLQNHPFSNPKKAGSALFFQDVMIVPPKLFHEFSTLAEKHGTPYFAISKLIVFDKIKHPYFDFKMQQFIHNSSLYFIMIANVETGEVIYREIKKVPGRLSYTKLYPVFYDSLYMLKKNLDS